MRPEETLQLAIREYFDHLQAAGNECRDSDFENAIFEAAVRLYVGEDAFDTVNQLIDERDNANCSTITFKYVD